MAWRCCAALLLTVTCCGDDDGDDDAGAGDADADADSDGDADADAGALPACPAFADVTATSEGRARDRLMRVESVTNESIRVADDPWCDPDGEVLAGARFPEVTSAAIRLPALGSEVEVTTWEFWKSSYGRFRDVEGTVLWEGGRVVEAPAIGSPFRVVADPAAEVCTPEVVAADDPCCCRRWRPMRAIVDTDDGPSELGPGESREVTIGGRPYVAAVTGAYEVLEEPCRTEAEIGPMLFATLAAAFDGAFGAQPAAVEPADDECPVDGMAEWGGCTTLFDRQCPQDAAGCVTTYQCRGCFWQVVGRGPWQLCPGDEQSCQGKGCPEELVCSDCSCPEPIGERWRCVGPDQPCPACE